GSARYGSEASGSKPVAPSGRTPLAGSRCRPSAKMRRRKSASTNEGKAIAPAIARPSARSSRPPGWRAAAEPATSPSAAASAMPSRATAAVTGSAFASISVVGWPARVENVAQRLATDVEPEDGDEDRERRDRREPPLRADDLGPVGDHVPPRRERRLHAEAEVAQARLDEDVRAHADGRRHDHDRRDVRQHVSRDDPPARRADRPRRRHGIAMPRPVHLATDDPSAHRPRGETDDEDEQRDAAAEGGDDEDDQEEGGEHHDELRRAHEERVHRAAEVAGDRADRDAGEDGDAHGEQADRERDAPAGEEAREHVAAERVRA